MISAQDAERAVLGACLLDPSVIPRVLDRLPQDAFGDSRHRRVYRALAAINRSGGVPDLVSVTESLRSAGELDAVDGASYLAGLMDSVVTAGHVDEHVAIVADRHLKRRLIAVGSGIVADANTARSGVECLDRAQHAVFDAWQHRGDREFGALADTVAPTLDDLEARARHGASVTGIASGIRGLDSLTLGWQPGDLVVLAARPSMGKTALALQWALEAGRVDVPVAVFSLEMSKKQLTTRMFAAEAGVPSWRLRKGALPPASEDWVRLSGAAGRMSEYPVHIDDSSALTDTEITAKARRVVAESGARLLVVDYLQLLRVPLLQGNRTVEVSVLSRCLKAIARELDVCVIALSQLSRAVERREDKRPILADLRDSGAIEQDADLIMFIYRPGQYQTKDQTGGETELLIRKHRNGPCGKVDLVFDAELMTFTEKEPSRPW